MLLKDTALLRLIGLRIPVLFLLGPRVIELDDDHSALEIPLTWRSRNGFIGAMYFGALCAGAELAAAMPAVRVMRGARDLRVVLAGLRAEFLKRADGDVVFRSRDPRRVAELAREALRTGERVGASIEVVATVPAKYGDEPVARFTIEFSMKRKAAQGARGASSGAPRAPGGTRRDRATAGVDAP